MLPPYRHPPPYACGGQGQNGVGASGASVMCQCCGQMQGPQWFQNQPPNFQHHPMIMQPPLGPPRMCPRSAAQLGKLQGKTAPYHKSP